MHGLRSSPPRRALRGAAVLACAGAAALLVSGLAWGQKATRWRDFAVGYLIPIGLTTVTGTVTMTQRGHRTVAVVALSGAPVGRYHVWLAAGTGCAARGADLPAHPERLHASPRSLGMLYVKADGTGMLIADVETAAIGEVGRVVIFEPPGPHAAAGPSGRVACATLIPLTPSEAAAGRALGRPVSGEARQPARPARPEPSAASSQPDQRSAP